MIASFASGPGVFMQRLSVPRTMKKSAGFVGAGFKPAQGVSGTSRDSFPSQGGFVPLTFMAHIATPRTMKFRLVFVKKRRSRLTFTRVCSQSVE